MPNQCIVKSCWPSFGRRLIRFPADRAEQLKWIGVLNVPDLMQLSAEDLHNGGRVCDRHFKPGDLIPAAYPGCCKRALRPGSLPVFADISNVQPKVSAVSKVDFLYFTFLSKTSLRWRAKLPDGSDEIVTSDSNTRGVLVDRRVTL